MSKSDTPSSLSQRLLRIIVLSLSLSLAVMLIIQAQNDVGHVAAQDRAQTQKDKKVSHTINLALFDDPKDLLDHEYAIELISDQSEHNKQEVPILKLHQPDSRKIRYLKHEIVQRLKQLDSQTTVNGLKTDELSRLKKLYHEIKRNLRSFNSRFAHSSKSMAPDPATQSQPVPVDSMTLAALNKLVELKR